MVLVTALISSLLDEIVTFLLILTYFFISYVHIIVSVVNGQPFVPPEFSTPAAPAGDDHTPSSTPGMIIMGVCLVSILFTAFVILVLVVCLYKPKAKEIDLSKPLILTEEVGKRKKRKDKKKAVSTNDKSFNPSDEVELMSSGAVAENERSETPPRTVDVVSLPSSPESTRVNHDLEEAQEQGEETEEGSTDEESSE